MKKISPMSHLLIGLLFVLAACSEGNRIPAEIRELVFEESGFSQPLLLSLPKESSRDLYEKVKAGEYNKSGGGLIPKLHIIISDVDDVQPSLRHFLMQNDMAAFETLRYGWPNGSRRTDFVFYTDKFKALLAELDHSTSSDDKYKLQVAHRRLKSIDYTNQYKAEPLGFPITFFAITFTYDLENDIEGLPHLERSFQGKAKAFLDPDDGKWKMEDLALEDRGSYEYLELIEERFTGSP